MHVRAPRENLGCDWCDQGEPRLCFEDSLGTNPLHLVGMELFKCAIPDIVYETEEHDSNSVS